MPGKNREKEVEQEKNRDDNNRRGTYSGQTSQGGGRGGTSAREPETGGEGGTNKGEQK